jgi:hypothetical protein
MKKAEMENHYDLHMRSIDRIKNLDAQGHYTEALKTAYEALDYIDGMIQYANKYNNQRFMNIKSIDYILEYAPLRFDFEGLERLKNINKLHKRIQISLDINIQDKITESQNLMYAAHQLWNYLENHPQALQNQLTKCLGSKQNQWNSIIKMWDKMGLIIRKKEGDTYNLDLRTRMGGLTFGKCPNCGCVQEAPKAMLLESTKCPDCGELVSFILRPSKE